MMETGQAGYSMEGSYMNQEINSYGPGPTSQGSDAYMRMNENMHMPHYNSYNRPGYQSMESNDYGNVNSGVGGYQPGAYSGPPRSNMGHMRHGSGGGMVPGPQGYSSGLPLMMSGQSISQQSGPTPTLNTLLQSPNTQPHYSSNYDGFSGPHKGSDMASANGGYGMPPGWMQQSPRGMGNYSQMPMPGSSPYRGQNQNYNQSGYPQYSNQGSTQPSPGQGQDQGSSPQQQRPTPQTSPHQSISPAPSPSPAHKLQHNRSPGPTRPKHPSSPGKPGRSSGRSVSPSSRSSSSQQSPPGHQQSNSQHNHLSSPKITSPGDDVKGEATPMRDSSRPEPSPGSVGSRSNTPSLSGSSPMPPRPPSQHDGSQPQRMSHSPMSSSGYNQQMMPPPMGPNQMGAGYNQGNYPMRQPGPGMGGNYPQNMYNGPSQMGPGGQHMYSNMNRGNYNMYPNSMMGMNNQYGNFNGPGPVPNSQGAPPGPNGMHNSGPQMNGPAPHSNMRPVSGGSVGSNGPVGPPTPSGTPIKGAQAAAQVAMATAARTQQPPTPGRQQPSSMAPSSRMYNGPPAGMPVHGPQHGMPPQSMSPLGHMYQMGNIPPHPQNSGSPVPPSSGKMHNNSNSVNNYGGDERPPPKSKKSKSSRGGGGGGHDSVNNNIQNNSIASPHMPMPSPGMSDNNSQGPRPSSTPASTLSDAGSQSNDSMGPLMNNDSGTGQVHSGHHGGHVNMDNNSPASFTNNIHEHTIRTVANAGGRKYIMETNTMVTQSITSPVTSLTTEMVHSNDSHPVPVLQNCIPTPQPHPTEDVVEPPEKKKKSSEGLGISQLPYSRIAPSPDGASIASSGTHEDIDNIGSPCGVSSTKSGATAGDYTKLYEMGMEPERKMLLDRLVAFLEEKGTPITNMPVISKQPIDLYRLYLIVQEKGGMVEVTKAKKWKEICGLINVSGSASAAFTLKKNYIKFLFAYECRFDRGNMDPAPVLAQMENDLERKRAAKHRQRAPSPGSQGSQDGLPNQFMSNEPHMGHMGQGMMGGHMMNNMGPHGGPMMGPNGMGGPHHMAPGMQGPGHMMGSMGPQNYGGSYGNMMQGPGPGPNMMGQGPQGMMGPGGMQGGPMMGSMGGPPQGGMMGPNNMGQHGMMGNMGNMPPNSMMPPNMMSGGNMGGMMPPSGQMNPNPMMRGHSMQQGPPSGAAMMPPNSMGNTSMPINMQMPNDSVSCLDPFADEPYHKSNPNQQQMPYSGMPPNSGAHDSSSPMPPASGAMPPNSSSMMPSAGAPMQSGHPPPHNAMAQSGGSPYPAPNSTPAAQGSYMSLHSNSMPMNGGPLPPASSQGSDYPPQSQPPGFDSMNSDSQENSLDVPPSSMLMSQNNSSMPPNSQYNDTAMTPVSNTSMQPNMPMSSEQPMYSQSQDSNSNSSLPDYSGPGTSQSAGQPGMDISSSQFSNASNTAGSTVRQFPFGDNQFNKPERFDQGSPSMSNSCNTPMSQAPMMNQPPMGMNQAGPMGPQGPMVPGQNMMGSQQPPMGPGPMGPQGSIGQQGPMQGPMTYQQSGGMPHGGYINPQQQPGMDQGHSGRYGNQAPDQYGQGNYHNRIPMMKTDQYQGYQAGQYGSQPMPGYSTPNKMYPDNRKDFNSPAYNSRCSSMGFTGYSDTSSNYSTPSRNPYSDPYSAENNFAPYGSQSYGGPPMMTYGDPPNTPHYQSAQQYNDYNDPSAASNADRGQGSWSQMVPRPYSQGPAQYGPSSGMGTPSGPQGWTRNRMSPTPRWNSNNMSPGKQKMPGGGSMSGQYKKDMFFPFESVEATQPLLNKRRRLTKHDVGPHGYKPYGASGANRRNRCSDTGQIEAWRIMMSLKSGLIAESTWALDTLNILLYDDSTVTYFGLGHLPGLLEVLLDHLRRCLIEIFDLFEDSQIASGHDDFKENLIRMAILESARKQADDDTVEEEKEINRVNKSLAKIEDTEEDSEEKPEVVDEAAVSKCETGGVPKGESEGSGGQERGPEGQLRPRRNYSLRTRQGKEVKVEEHSDPNGLLDEKVWDVYGEFGEQTDNWEIGKGDLTEHIFTHFEDRNEHKNNSKRFFCRPMKRKADSNLERSDLVEDCKDSKSKEGAIKEETTDVDVEDSVCNKDSDSERCETSSNTTDSSCEKNHSCNAFIKSETLKLEHRDLLSEKNDSNDSPCDEKICERSFFKDDPRIKLAVKYELLDNDELVQVCKTQFGLNTEGERCGVEDESYQRNEPPLCLTSEAQHEIARRCICVSNIFRNLSFIPGNDLEMSKHSGLIYILGELLLLYHKHLPRSRVRRKFDRDDIDENMVDTTQGIDEWWWDCLSVLRENTLVIFANICAQLKLDVFPDAICLPILDGMLHWVVCPSACASDPLPTVGPTSVLSPLRLVLEALCKLCIHDKNVDMLLACPPYERIVQLFSVLTKLLANKSEQVTMEFAIVLLSELVRGGSSAARGIALQHPVISLLIDFIETAEQKALQVANMHTVQMLRDNPEMMGTSLDMLRRAASVLTHLARVPENRKLFVHHQSRLLALVMSQILDHNVAAQLSDVLFQCSNVS